MVLCNSCFAVFVFRGALHSQVNHPTAKTVSKKFTKNIIKRNLMKIENNVIEFYLHVLERL